MDSYELNHNIGFLVNDLSRLITAEYNRTMKPIGLTRSQWRVIVHLHREDGMTQSQLAELLEVGKVTVGGLIDRLEHSGWLERRDDTADRRTKRIYLTSKGRDIEKDMHETGKQLTRRILRNLAPDERTQLVDLLIAVKADLTEQSEKDTEDKAVVKLKPRKRR